MHENTRALAKAVRIAADVIDGRARRPDDHRPRGGERVVVMRDDEAEGHEAERTADDVDDVLAPAKDLLRLLDGNERKAADARLLTWHIGQKRPAQGAAKDGKESEWVLIGKYATKEEARVAARCRPNGVRFRIRRNTAQHSYYVCVTHEDKGCPCVMRVSRPTHRGATGDWLIERRGGETCDAHAEIRSEEVIVRETHDLVDADGAPAIGVAPMKHCRDGRQRGVHPNLISLITRLRKEGVYPAAILTELHKLWNNGGLEGSITTKGDLPSAKQLKVRMIPTWFLCSVPRNSRLTMLHRISSTLGVSTGLFAPKLAPTTARCRLREPVYYVKFMKTVSQLRLGLRLGLRHVIVPPVALRRASVVRARAWSRRLERTPRRRRTRRRRTRRRRAMPWVRACASAC